MAQTRLKRIERRLMVPEETRRSAHFIDLEDRVVDRETRLRNAGDSVRLQRIRAKMASRLNEPVRKGIKSEKAKRARSWRALVVARNLGEEAPCLLGRPRSHDAAWLEREIGFSAMRHAAVAVEDGELGALRVLGEHPEKRVRMDPARLVRDLPHLCRSEEPKRAGPHVRLIAGL